MTAEEVVEAAIAVCRKLEEKYHYTLDAEFNDCGVFEDRDWSDFCEDI
jgi:hypothetical protein